MGNCVCEDAARVIFVRFWHLAAQTQNAFPKQRANSTAKAQNIQWLQLH
jgi:hypothetical protein